MSLCQQDFTMTQCKKGVSRDLCGRASQYHIHPFIFNVLKDSYGPPPGIVKFREVPLTHLHNISPPPESPAPSCWHRASISNGVKRYVQCPRFQATVFFVGVQLCCHHCYLHPHYVMSDTTVQTFFSPVHRFKSYLQLNVGWWNGSWVIYYRSAPGPCLQ